MRGPAGTGYTPHNGNALRVAVVELGAQRTVVATDEQVVAGGAFTFVFPALLVAGRSYELDYYADFNGSGYCDVPLDDHVWRDAVPGPRCP